MKKTILLFTLCLLLILPAAWAQAEHPTLLTLYEGPKTMQTSGTASVTVNGYPLSAGGRNFSSSALPMSAANPLGAASIAAAQTMPIIFFM